MKTLFSAMAVSFLFLAGAVSAQDGKTVHVAIIPFELNAQADIAYMGDAVYDMISSRIYLQDEVLVISRSLVEDAVKEVGNDAVDEVTAEKIGTILDADYVFYGTLTEFGASFSIDTVMVNMDTLGGNWPFFSQAENIDAVIPKVEKIVGKINRNIFGRSVPEDIDEEDNDTGQVVVPEKYASPEKLISETDSEFHFTRERPFWKFWGDEYDESVEDIFQENDPSMEAPEGDGTGDVKVETGPLDIEEIRIKNQPFWKRWIR